MTWLKSDSGHKPSTDPLSKRGRTPAPSREPIPPQPDLLDANGEPTMSVFQAMGIGVNGEGIWGEETTRDFPMDVQRELARDFGWMPQRQWDLTRKFMFRDIEAT